MEMSMWLQAAKNDKKLEQVHRRFFSRLEESTR